MRSPFNDLGKTHIQDSHGEPVGGAFSCQEYGCMSIVTEATYFDDLQAIIYVCEHSWPA